ncbi:hypothetical protein [Streptomyces sp. NPDC059909]|uniref:hypothetical protein n=1 Tax=Streptomyces sp. NPDC059909 TaxID=3346998 RepID=UPI00365023C3
MDSNPPGSDGAPAERAGLDLAGLLARQLLEALAAAGHTVAVAESLTGAGSVQRRRRRRARRRPSAAG